MCQHKSPISKKSLTKCTDMQKSCQHLKSRRVASSSSPNNFRNPGRRLFWIICILETEEGALITFAFIIITIFTIIIIIFLINIVVCSLRCQYQLPCTLLFAFLHSPTPLSVHDRLHLVSMQLKATHATKCNSCNSTPLSIHNHHCHHHKHFTHRVLNHLYSRDNWGGLWSAWMVQTQNRCYIFFFYKSYFVTLSCSSHVWIICIPMSAEGGSDHLAWLLQTQREISAAIFIFIDLNHI